MLYLRRNFPLKIQTQQQKEKKQPVKLEILNPFLTIQKDIYSFKNRINRGNTTINKNPHFISLTGSEATKLEFPVKINRKNKVIKEKLRMKFLETVK